MVPATEKIALALAMVLACLAAVMSSGDTAQQWSSDYIMQAFAPSVADLGTSSGQHADSPVFRF